MYVYQSDFRRFFSSRRFFWALDLGANLPLNLQTAKIPRGFREG